MHSFTRTAVTTIGLLMTLSLHAQQSLSDSINTLATAAQGRVGTFMQDLETGDSITTNDQDHYPMQSVFKFPLALYVLDQVDKGKLSLTTPINIRKSEWARMYSALLNKYPNEHISLTVEEVLAATVGASDNVGCDLLFRLVGGPAKVNDFIHGLGIRDISIVYTEMGMAADWNNQYADWCRPSAMGQLLRRFYRGELLSPASTRLLLKWMTESSSPHRISGMLPEGTVVAHKTGSSNTNAAGITAATNDAGIITLPNGHHLIMVIFVSDAKAGDDIRLRTMSRIGLAGYNHYNRP
jgi:beta-lactamase class A